MQREEIACKKRNRAMIRFLIPSWRFFEKPGPRGELELQLLSFKQFEFCSGLTADSASAPPIAEDFEKDFWIKLSPTLWNKGALSLLHSPQTNLNLFHQSLVDRWILLSTGSSGNPQAEMSSLMDSEEYCRLHYHAQETARGLKSADQTHWRFRVQLNGETVLRSPLEII